MQPLQIVSSALICLYGGLNAFAGFAQLKAKNIPPWSAWLMLGIGGLLIVSGVILGLRRPYALALLAFCLISIHLITIYNGFYLHSRINPRHHLPRFVGSVILLGLAFLSGLS